MSPNPQNQSPAKRSNPSDDDLALDALLNPAANYPRKRVAIACEVCRTRKTRCDAKRPCGFCAEAGVECVYRQSAHNEKYSTAADILSRIEDRLARLEDIIVAKASPEPAYPNFHGVPSSSLNSHLSRQMSADSVSIASSAVHSAYGSSRIPPPPPPPPVRTSFLDTRKNFHRITLPSYADTPFRPPSTEPAAPRPSLVSFRSPLFLKSESWDETQQYYDDQLAQQIDLAAQIENARTSITLMLPPINVAHIYSLQNKFLTNVLRWFPLFDAAFLVELSNRAQQTNWAISEPATCLSMLAFAISDVFDEKTMVNLPSPMVTPKSADTGSSPTVISFPSGPKAPALSPQSPRPVLASERGLRYYVYACVALLPLRHQKHNVFVMQCRILQATYLNITFRTLASWDVTSELARDLMHFLSSSLYSALDPPTREAFNRVFWTTSILLLELESPLKMHASGLSEYQDLVSLPYSNVEEESFYYFFAQVSVRGLFSDALEIASHATPVPAVAEELLQQIDKWYHALPPAITFSLDSAPLFDLRKAFLRYQYFASRIVMLWPAVLKLLESNATRAHEHLQVSEHLLGAQQESRMCIQSCVQCCYASTEVLSCYHLGLHLSIWISHFSMTLLLIVHCLPGLAFVPETRNPDPIRKAYQSLCRWEYEPFLQTALDRSRRMMQKAAISY